MLRVGTRGSKLALTQTHEVIRKIKAFDDKINCEIVKIKTTGDTITDRSLVDIGGKALFLKEIEESLLMNNIDIAVHCLKDVPAVLPNGLIIPAVVERSACEDVLIANNSLMSLPHGSIIGTCASRRKAFLNHILGDRIKIVDMRGNIDTRIEKFKRGEFDGIILAKAGIDRIGMSHIITEVIPKNLMLPAIGQGAIAIECKEDNKSIIALLQSINHINSYICITAERGFMIEMHGDCKTPIAALAEIKDGVINLDAAFIIPDGSKIFSASLSTQYTNLESAHQLGMKAAQMIKKDIVESEYFESIRHLFGI
jgi:hydroxymethylbilane synthase